MARILVAVLLVSWLGAPVAAQQIQFTNNESGGVIITTVYAGKAKQFEEAILVLRRALSASANPTHQQQAATWRMYRVKEAPRGAALYVFFFDPPAPNADYGLKAMIDSTFSAKEANQLFRQIAEAIVEGQNRLSLHAPGTRSGSPSTQTSGAPAPSAGVISKTGTIGDGLLATVETKVMETNTVWWKYSWKVTLKNSGAATFIGATVEFQDADGFPIDTSTEQRTQVGADEVVLTGFELIDVGVAPNVRKVDLKVRTIRQ